MTPAASLHIPRLCARRVAAALADTPVVMITGPRQSGKTTLAHTFSGSGRTYLTLDDDTVLAAARSDPAGFLRGLGRVTIDEVQRAPELLRAIKRTVDEDRSPGRFLLTGSANILTLPQVSESLAGRMEAVTLLPLAQAEIKGRKPVFLDKAFAGTLARPREILTGDALTALVLAGGYPEMLRRRDPKRRQAWAQEYIKAIVQRDLRDLAAVEKLDRMPRLLRVLAQHAGQLANLSQAGGQIGLDAKTVGKYIAILEQVYLVRRIEPWSRNRLKRVIKTPKVHFLDSGLLAAMLGLNPSRLAANRAPLGPLLESFAFSELLKQSDWANQSRTLMHYRDKDQDEVDLVAESDDGAVVGIEIKASATVNAADFRGLRKLAAACGRPFKLGVVLYDGDQTVPFGDRLFAAPLACLWA